MSLLDALWRGGHLRTLDHALAQSLRRLDRDTPDPVLAAAALASLAVASGHAGFDPAEPQRLFEGELEWPAPQAWRDALAASRWVACPKAGDVESAADVPLVFEQGLVYLRRYREYERRLAAGLRRIGSAASPDAALNAGAPAPASDDLQRQAVDAALHHHLLLVTGGPGTGKTTTIARMLVALIARARDAGAPPPRIALAAPTGRAAERMAESVRNALAKLEVAGIDPALCAALPASGSTLHRLLGTLPDSPRFRHDAANPLEYDVVVVDEASMIDLPLMAKLVDAVADGTCLVLLGDPDQLPSVEAGDVLAAILRAAGPGDALDAEEGRALAPLLGTPASPTGAASTQPAFGGRRVHLVRGYRQSDRLELAPLAKAVREGDGDQALSLLRAGRLSNVHYEDGGDPLQAHRERLLGHWQALAEADTPAAALAEATRLRILTAVREGPQGARTLNARIEALLRGRLDASPRSRGGPAQEGFHGRLVLVSENSYRHRLFNGDIGICLQDGDGHLVAWFPGDTPDNPRAFHPATLPAHDSAFAMTVHKAQGSEFDAVWLLLPARDNRVLSRELVYTGLTRARNELHLVASEPVLRQALSRHVRRVSGLAWRLGAD